jgi:hypothetical protein
MSAPNPSDESFYDSMSSPTMGLAMGLLSAGGPSRMPVSLGQALGQGLQNAQLYASQDWQRQLQWLMALRRLQQMQEAGGRSPEAPANANSDNGGRP